VLEKEPSFQLLKRFAAAGEKRRRDLEGRRDSLNKTGGVKVFVRLKSRLWKGLRIPSQATEAHKFFSHSLLLVGKGAQKGLEQNGRPANIKGLCQATAGDATLGERGKNIERKSFREWVSLGETYDGGGMQNKKKKTRMIKMISWKQPIMCS